MHEIVFGCVWHFGYAGSVSSSKACTAVVFSTSLSQWYETKAIQSATVFRAINGLNWGHVRIAKHSERFLFLRGEYQNCSVLYYVLKLCSVISTLRWAVLIVLWIGLFVFIYLSFFSALTLLVRSFDPQKPVPDMTYNVFRRTLNLAQSNPWTLVVLTSSQSIRKHQERN